MPQLLVESRIVAFSKAAVRKLKNQDQSPALKGLIDQIAVLLAEDPPEGGTPPEAFAISRVVTAEETEQFLRRINQLEGIDLLSTPRVTTKSGQKATVEITQEYPYPDKFTRVETPGVETVVTPTNFRKKNTGFTLEVEGVIAPARDVVDLNVSWEMASIQGYVRTRDGQPIGLDQAQTGGKQPVFVTQTIETCVTMPLGRTLILGNPSRNSGVPEALQRDARFREAAIVLNFITVTPVDTKTLGVKPTEGQHENSLPPVPSPSPSPSGAAAPAPTADAGATASPPPDATTDTPDENPANVHADFPSGKPVPGKPGFVTSPYPPNLGMIDVRAFPTGQQVVDPFTNKIFLVP